MTTETAYIGLGSNLKNPRDQVAAAVEELHALPDTRVTATSSWYRSDPVGPGPQPDYINGVVAVETALKAEALLRALHGIEDAHGRERTRRWGARTLDLDLLFYGSVRRDSPELTLPHPRITERNFVILPLAEIAPDFVLPDGTPIHELLANTPSKGIVRL